MGVQLTAVTDSVVMEECHGAGHLVAYLMSHRTGQGVSNPAVVKAWPENWENETVMLAVGTGDSE